MALTLLLALQSAAAAPAPRWAMPALIASESGAAPLALGREGVRSAGVCLPAAGTDVLVCGPRRGGAGAYPLAYWARIFGPEPPIRAEMGLGGSVQGRIYSEAVPMDRGAVSNRAMIGIRWPF